MTAKPAAADRLAVLIGGREVALLRRDRRRGWLLAYDAQWRSSSAAFPLSVSLPLAAEEHGPGPVEAFVRGLLPDNDQILDRWARRFQVSARNPFALVAHVGEDCPGAVQIVRPERVEVLAVAGPFQVEWLVEAGVAARLGLLRRDQAAWRAPQDAGQFSLAGAQPKTALLLDEGRWGVPFGRTPTTHILKPPSGELDGHIENEHFCLALARAVGLPTAGSEVMRFGDEVAIVVERYDRIRATDLAATAAAESAARAAQAAAARDAGEAARAAAAAAEAAARANALGELAKTRPILRLHQEDLCQAFGLPPTAKYQNEGGPTPEAIAALLREHSSRPREDVATFVGALAFNWLIAGTDGHAKNYSLLHGRGGRVRLAPLYDLASALPYEQMPLQRLRLAMKVGGTYRLRDIGGYRWRRLAAGCRLDADATLAQLAELASRVVQSAGVIRDRCLASGLSHPVLDRLAAAVTDRAARCLQVIRGGG